MRVFKRLRKHLPTPKEVEGNRYAGLFGDSLKRRELWIFSRRSTAKGIAIGLFCAFLPMPFEMVAAAFMAITLLGNLPLALAGVWISNPVTWVPLYTPCYLLGAWIVGIEPIPLEEITLLKLGWHYVALWLGCLIIGSIVALLSLATINILWRLEIKNNWQRRAHQRQIRKLANANLSKLNENATNQSTAGKTE
jgi:uncharacterized protein (DUF2062 family)